ncbi:hypothetical protein GQ457_04G029600 [Hibiscus cannabinus]
MRDQSTLDLADELVVAEDDVVASQERHIVVASHERHLVVAKQPRKSEGRNRIRIVSYIPKGSMHQREGRIKVNIKDLKPKRIKDYLECKISQRTPALLKEKPSFHYSQYVLNLPPGED